MDDLYPQYSAVSSVTSSGAPASETLYLGGATVWTYSTGIPAADPEVSYFGIVAHFRTYTARPPVSTAISIGLGLASTWDQTEVRFGGSAYDFVYRPSEFVFACSPVRGHDEITADGQGTPQAYCFGHPLIGAEPSSEIAAVGLADLRQGIDIAADGLTLAGYPAIGTAHCLVKGWETVAAQVVAVGATEPCTGHPFIAAATPSDWSGPECFRPLPEAAPALARNYAF